MKRVALVLSLLIPVSAHAAPRWDLGKGYSIGIDTSLDIEGVGARDLKNGMWLTGVSKELTPLFKNDRKIAYLAGSNLFMFDEAGKGAFGLALGVPTGPATDLLGSWAQKLVPSAKLPQWVKSLSNWTSFEIGTGYRFFGVPDHLSPWVYTIGGRVRVPLDILWANKSAEEPAE